MSSTIQKGVQKQVSLAIKNGDSITTLSKNLQNLYSLSKDKAEEVAHTEIANADVQGNLIAYRHAGVKKKKWILGEGACNYCKQNEKDGVIDFDATFTTGVQAPPGHPGCRCDILPILDKN